MKIIISAISVAALWFGAAFAADDASNAVTIYSSAAPGSINPELYRPTMENEGWAYGQQIPGYALVRQQREVNLPEKRSKVEFSDVAAYIDPTTVTFKSLTDPKGTSVLEQNFMFDLVNTQALMQRYIDQPISVERTHGDRQEILNGMLLSAQNGLTLKLDGGKIFSTPQYTGVTFPTLPGGFYTKPTLVWDVMTGAPGKQKVETSYETKGMTWWADYNLVFSEGKDENSGLLDIGAWVSIVNKSGAGYPDSKLKLIAGDVHRAQPANVSALKSGITFDEEAFLKRAPEFSEKSFFEFHLYTLGRPTTLPNNSTKQIEMFPKAVGVPVEKLLIYNGAPSNGWLGNYYSSPTQDRNFGGQSNKKVNVYLKFKNSDKNGMGMPLPAGRIRVSKLDKDDGALEFIGEDTIGHTPKDEDVLIKLGDAFDVVGERKQTDFQINTAQNWIKETFEITLRNHKSEAVNVDVKENLYRWNNWKVLDASQKYEKEDVRTIRFPVTVPKDGEQKITYTVEYRW